MTPLPATAALGPIDHIGIAVSDLDAALTLYTETLGWRVDHRETNVEQGVEEVMLQPAEGSGDTQIQLLGALTPDSPVGVFLSRRGPGLHHVAYRTADLAAASDRLGDGGLRLLYAVPRAGTRGSRINFVHPKDTGGTLIELVESAAGSERGHR